MSLNKAHFQRNVLEVCQREATLLFIEESIEEGIKWVVCEPNGQRLEGRLRNTAL